MSKTDKEGKLHANLNHVHRCKDPKWNFSKPNLAMYKINNTSYLGQLNQSWEKEKQTWTLKQTEVISLFWWKFYEENKYSDNQKCTKLSEIKKNK